MAINKVTGITFMLWCFCLIFWERLFQVYSLKCYRCRSSIRNCLLPEHRIAATCAGSLICFKANAYDRGESILGNKFYSNFIFSSAKKQICFMYREHYNTHWRCVALSCELIIHNKAKFRSEINGVLKVLSSLWLFVLF